jgi:flagellar basal-body rod protein FlgF
MIRGLYTSASGMLAELTRNDVSANNLANINTAGYRKNVAVFKSFPEMLLQRMNDTSTVNGGKPPVIGKVGTGVIVDDILTSYNLGQLKETSSPFDLALGGEGFFTVQTPNGERYTRNGSFTIDKDRNLITTEGYLVLGEKGPIKVTGKDFVIESNGNVNIDGKIIDKMKIVDFADKKSLVKEGDNLFQGQQAVPAETNQLLQGFLEMANVNPITEMVDMITILRAYEANQKAVQAHDTLLGKAVNDVGRV